MTNFVSTVAAEPDHVYSAGLLALPDHVAQELKTDGIAAYQTFPLFHSNDTFVPGAHIAIATPPDVADIVSMSLRLAGIPIRDTILWLRSNEAEGHRLIIVGRKPLSGTVADNVLRFGAGAINIEPSRVAMTTTDQAETEAKNDHSNPAWEARTRDHARTVYGTDNRPMVSYDGSKGRFPSNLLIQHTTECEPVTVVSGQTVKWNCVKGCPGKELDTQSGVRAGGSYPTQRSGSKATNFSFMKPTEGGARPMGDTGGASRFFRQFSPDNASIWSWIAQLLCPPGSSIITSGIPRDTTFPPDVHVVQQEITRHGNE